YHVSLSPQFYLALRRIGEAGCQVKQIVTGKRANGGPRKSKDKGRSSGPPAVRRSRSNSRGRRHDPTCSVALNQTRRWCFLCSKSASCRDRDRVAVRAPDARRHWRKTRRLSYC